MSQATTTKLYTRDEVLELVHKAHSKAIRKTVLKDYAEKAGNEAGSLLLITAIAVKMASNADRKLEKLLDKAEGKK